MINITRAPRGFVLVDVPAQQKCVAWIVESTGQSHVDCTTLQQGDRYGEATSVAHAHIDGEIICGRYNGHQLVGSVALGTGSTVTTTTSNGISTIVINGVLSTTYEYLSYSASSSSRRTVTRRVTNHLTGSVREEKQIMTLVTFEDTSFDTVAFQASAFPRLYSLLELPNPGFQYDLQVEACEAATPISSNNLENLKQVRDLVGLIATKGKNLSSIVERGSKYLNRNVDDTFKALNGLDIGEKIKMSSDSWLAYRYAYNTTMMDIHEHQKGLGPALYQLRHFDELVIRSYASKMVDGWKCVFAMKARPHITNAVQGAWLKSASIGLQVNTKNLWDLVPFSFVVDWFAPVDNVLATLDRSVQWREANYTFLSLTSSCKRVATWSYLGHSLTEIVYVREAYPEMPNFGIVWKDNTSDRTKVYRCVDAVALAVGQV